jgi:hypothetical protein
LALWFSLVGEVSLEGEGEGVRPGGLLIVAPCSGAGGWEPPGTVLGGVTPKESSMLRIYPVLLELVATLRPMVRQLERRDADLARQPTGGRLGCRAGFIRINPAPTLQPAT